MYQKLTKIINKIITLEINASKQINNLPRLTLGSRVDWYRLLKSTPMYLRQRLIN